MKIAVDQAKCIGCGACVAIAEKSFKLTDDNKAQPIEPAGDPETKIKEAGESCPTAAITLN